MLGTIRKITRLPSLPHRKRVAAYARVSCGKDAMLHSLSAQVSYYSSLIQKNPEWEYTGVFIDVDASYGLNPKSSCSICMGGY